MHLHSNMFNLGLGTFIGLHRSKFYGMEKSELCGRWNKLHVWMESVTVGVVRAYDPLKTGKMGSKVCL